MPAAAVSSGESEEARRRANDAVVSDDGEESTAQAAALAGRLRAARCDVGRGKEELGLSPRPSVAERSASDVGSPAGISLGGVR